MHKEPTSFGRPVDTENQLFDTFQGELSLDRPDYRPTSEKLKVNTMIMGKNALRAMIVFGKTAKENFGAAGETIRDAAGEAKENITATINGEPTEDPKDL